ncbi:MAG: hypothetical protein H7330_15720 [Hymenobacteraceae bacterium]|nr:hypothetical protein [Hymenobacteraceae bacterium]
MTCLFIPSAGRSAYATLLTLSLAFALTLSAGSARAQTLGNSPYSRLGIGEAAPGAGLLRNQGMGGTGVAAPTSAYANEINPALNWHTRYVTFDVGVTGQLKNLKTATQQQRTGNGTISYLTLALPITPRWGAVVGLRPLATVDFENRSEIGITGDPLGRVEVVNRGEGGLSQAYMSHGIQVAGGLSVGAEASFVFGSVETANSTRLLAGTNTGESVERTIILERRRYGDLVLRTGLAYEQKLPSGVLLTAGATVQLGSDLHVTRRRLQERRSVALQDQILESLLLSDSVRSRSHLPASFTGGLGVTNEAGTRTFTVEATSQAWSRFRADGIAQRSLTDAWRVAAGGEWTPDPNSVESYFRRVTYRAGVYGGRNGWRDRAGEALQDAGVTWGFALPLGKVATFEGATLQTSFAYGQRGFNSSMGVRESYLRAQIGVAFSSIWFVKRRIE